MIPFEKWPSIKRFDLDIYGQVTEKLDGTNGILHIGPDGEILAGSRNGWLVDRDNYGFNAWVQANKDKLLVLGPGYHYGEWWGCGIQRRYDQATKRFSLFNTKRYNPEQLALAGVETVPVLYEGPIDAAVLENVVAELSVTGSVAAPGFMNPEGIVVKVGDNVWKWTFEGNKHKGA